MGKKVVEYKDLVAFHPGQYVKKGSIPSVIKRLP